MTRLLETIVSILRERRLAAGIPKKRLAETAGVTRTAIILMENGERLPSLELALRLSAGLGLSLGDVIKEAEMTTGSETKDGERSIP